MPYFVSCPVIFKVIRGNSWHFVLTFQPRNALGFGSTPAVAQSFLPSPEPLPPSPLGYGGQVGGQDGAPRSLTPPWIRNCHALKGCPPGVHWKNTVCLVDKTGCALYSAEPKSLTNCRKTPYHLLCHAALARLPGVWLWVRWRSSRSCWWLIVPFFRETF